MKNPGAESFEIPNSIGYSLDYFDFIIESLCGTVCNAIFKGIEDFFSPVLISLCTFLKFRNSAVSGIRNPVVEFHLLFAISFHVADVIKPFFHSVCQSKVIVVQKH